MSWITATLWLIGWMILLAFAVPTPHMKRDPSSPLAYYGCWWLLAVMYLSLSHQVMWKSDSVGWFLPLSIGGMVVMVEFELIRRWVRSRRYQ